MIRAVNPRTLPKTMIDAGSGTATLGENATKLAFDPSCTSASPVFVGTAASTPRSREIRNIIFIFGFKASEFFLRLQAKFQKSNQNESESYGRSV